MGNKKSIPVEEPPICDSCGKELSDFEVKHGLCTTCAEPPICGVCSGSGESSSPGVPCWKCGGDGTLKIKNNVIYE